MWILLFVLLTPVAGMDRTYALETYPTRALCEAERTRVTSEMQISYPNDTTWELRCRLSAKGV